MSTSEIKKKLHQLIDETDDFEILEKVKNYFDNLRTEKRDWWECLSSYEKLSTEKAIQEVEQGKILPHEEVRTEINELLKDKN